MVLWKQATLGAGLLAIAASGAAVAQDTGRNDLEIRLNMAGTFSDNFYYEDAQERSVAGALLSPILEYTRQSNAADFGLTAKGELAGFSYGHQDNYADALGAASVNFKLPAKMILGFTGTGQYGHDPFGTERTEGLSSQVRDLDKWTQYSGSVSLTGGQADSAKIGYELKYTSLQRDYQSNEVNTRFLDRRVDSGSATLFYNFSPKLSVLAQATGYDLSYDNVRAGSIDRSGDAIAGMLGVRWAATAKTSGDIRVGQGEFKPDNRNISTFDTSYWQASLSWAPTRKISFKATGGRQYLPTYRFDAVYIDDRNVSLEWRQLWTYRGSTKLTLGGSKRNFVGIAEQHDYFSAKLRYDYQLDRGLHLYISYGYLDRDAVTDTQDFSTNTARIGLETKFN